MPKICFFLDSFFPNDPRVEKEIKTIQKIGWEVSIIALDKEGAPKKDHWDNCEVYRVKHPKFFGIIVFIFLFQLVNHNENIL